MSQSPAISAPASRGWVYTQRPRSVRALSEAEFWGRAITLATTLIWVGAFVYGFRTAVLLSALLGFLGATVGLARPVIGLYCVGLIAVLDGPIRVCLATGGLFRENTFNYLMLLNLVFFPQLLLRRREAHTWLLMSVLGLLSLELFMSPGLMRGVLHLMNGFAGLGMVLYFIRGLRDDATWFWLAMVSSSTAALGGACYYLQKEDLPYFDRNGLAYFFLSAMFCICLAFRSASQRRFGTLSLGLLAVVCGCWVFLTTSRGGMLIGSVAALCLLAEVRSLGGRLMIALGGVIVAMGLLAQFTDIQDKSVARLEKLFDSERSLASRTSGRSELVKGAWRIFIKNPLGVGTGGYADKYAEESREVGQFRFAAGHTASAHSAWLKTLAENGVPGMVLLVAYVYSFVFVGWQRRKQGLFFLGLLPTVAFTVGFMTSEFQGKGLWFLAAGVTVLMHAPWLQSNVAAVRRASRSPFPIHSSFPQAT